MKNYQRNPTQAVEEIQQPLFPGGANLFQPPAGLFAGSARLTSYALPMRSQTLYLLHNDPLTLKLSLREWLTSMMGEASDRTSVSTRRLGHMLYSRRAIKLREFTRLMGASTFAQAVCELTGAQVGVVREEHLRRLREQELLELGPPSHLVSEAHRDTGAMESHPHPNTEPSHNVDLSSQNNIISL